MGGRADWGVRGGGGGGGGGGGEVGRTNTLNVMQTRGGEGGEDGAPSQMRSSISCGSESASGNRERGVAFALAADMTRRGPEARVKARGDGRVRLKKGGERLMFFFADPRRGGEAF